MLMATLGIKPLNALLFFGSEIPKTADRVILGCESARMLGTS